MDLVLTQAFRDARLALRQQARSTQLLYRGDAMDLTAIASRRFAFGRVPCIAEIAVATAQLRVTLQEFDARLGVVSLRALWDAEIKWMRSYWSEGTHGVLSDSDLYQEVSIILGGEIEDENAPTRVGRIEVCCRVHDRMDAYWLFHRALQEWEVTLDVLVRLPAETAYIEASTTIPNEVRVDLLSVTPETYVSSNARVLIGYWRRGLEDAIRELRFPEHLYVNNDKEPVDFEGLVCMVWRGREIISCETDLDRGLMEALKRREVARPSDEDPATLLMHGSDFQELHTTHGLLSVMRLLDRIGVDPLVVADRVLVWNGPHTVDAQWHLYERGGHTILVSLNFRDWVYNQMLSVPGTIEDAMAWMKKSFTGYRGKPGPAEANVQPALADALQARRGIETYRRYQQCVGPTSPTPA